MPKLWQHPITQRMVTLVSRLQLFDAQGACPSCRTEGRYYQQVDEHGLHGFVCWRCGYEHLL